MALSTDVSFAIVDCIFQHMPFPAVVSLSLMSRAQEALVGEYLFCIDAITCPRQAFSQFEKRALARR
jgi:hypothetical protein